LVNSYHVEAIKALGEKNYALAQTCFEKLAASEAESRLATYWLGRIYEATDRKADAAAVMLYLAPPDRAGGYRPAHLWQAHRRPRRARQGPDPTPARRRRLPPPGRGKPRRPPQPPPLGGGDAPAGEVRRGPGHPRGGADRQPAARVPHGPGPADGDLVRRPGD